MGIKIRYEISGYHDHSIRTLVDEGVSGLRVSDSVAYIIYGLLYFYFHSHESDADRELGHGNLKL